MDKEQFEVPLRLIPKRERGVNVTAEGNKQTGQTQGEDKKGFKTITDAWKKMYYENEAVLASSMDEYVAGQSFTDLLEQMGSQYMTAYKVTTQNTDKFFANSPLATKKDIARVCELVIAVEEKVDNLESNFNGNMASLASSLMRLVDYQAILKDDLWTIHEEVKAMQRQVLMMQGNKAGSAAPADKPVAKVAAESPRTDQKGARPTEEVQSNPVLEQTKPTPPTTPPRPRSRSKETQPKK